jgi:hypothetical protein
VPQTGGARETDVAGRLSRGPVARRRVCDLATCLGREMGEVGGVRDSTP